jgi:hypothetical protein
VVGGLLALNPGGDLILADRTPGTALGLCSASSSPSAGGDGPHHGDGKAAGR